MTRTISGLLLSAATVLVIGRAVTLGHAEPATSSSLVKAPQAGGQPSIASVAMLPPKTFSAELWDSGFAKAQGSWVLVGGSLAEPVRTSVITCVKQFGHCFQSSASISGANMLLAELELLEIERWDAHEIVTKPTDAVCARSTIRVDRDQQSVTELQSTFATAACKSLGVSARDEHRKIVDGLDVVRQIQSAKR